jgi:GLPGLI family protein
MKTISRLILIAVILSASVLLNAQKLFEGEITYKIEYLSLPPEIEGMEGMLPSVLKVYYKGAKTRTEQELMGSSTQIVVEDQDNNNFFVLMDLMGQKIVLESTTEEIKEQEEIRNSISIKLINEKKEIAGYSCKKAVIESEESEVPISIYYAAKLKSGRDRFKGIDGIALQFSISNGGVQARMTAVLVEKIELNEALFDIPEGYNSMTSNDMMKMLGGGQ